MTDNSQNTEDLIRLSRALRLVDLPAYTARCILEEYNIRIIRRCEDYDKSGNTLYVSREEAELIFETHRKEHLYAETIPDWGCTRKKAAEVLHLTVSAIATYCKRGLLTSYEVFTPKGKRSFVSKAECQELRDIRNPQS